MRRPNRVVGAVLAVPLGDGTSCFALTLPEAEFAFFDSRSVGQAMPSDLLARPILFRVAVMKYATRNWPRVGKASLPSALLAPAPKFMQDPLNPKRFEIYLRGVIRPASRAECEGLERAAVWEPEHVEDRLRDHYAGVPNKWVEQLGLT
jgi:hypothetical protein